MRCPRKEDTCLCLKSEGLMKMKGNWNFFFKNGDLFYQPGIISSWRDMLDLSWGKVEFQESWRLNSSLSSEWISSITLWWMISDCKKKCYHPSLLLCNDLSIWSALCFMKKGQYLCYWKIAKLQFVDINIFKKNILNRLKNFILI